MAGPWEQYQQQPAGPWTAYQAKPLTPEEIAAAKEARTRELVPGVSVNPTDGMGAGAKFAAGNTQSFRDLGLGLVQNLSEGGPIAGGPMNVARMVADKFGVPMMENPVKAWADSKLAENADADAALLDTGWGLGGNVAGTVSSMFLPGGVATAGSKVPQFGRGAGALKAVGSAFMPTTIKGGVMQGGLLGGVQPVKEGQSQAGNTVKGLLGGFVGGVLPRIAGGAVRATGRTLSLFTDKGIENAAGRTLQRFTEGRPLDFMPDPILGKSPTIAEATMDPGVAQFQSLTRNYPAVATAVTTSRQAANEARASALDPFAGTPQARTAAVEAIDKAEDAAYGSLEGVGDVNVQPVVRQLDRILAGPSGKIPEVRASLQKARQQFFEPYEESARIKDARSIVDMAIGGRMSSADHAALKEARRLLSNRAGASADEIVEALGDIKATSKTAQTAINQAKELANSLNVAFENEVPRLVAARQAITNQLSGLGDDKGGPLAKKQLMEIREALEAQIRKVTPNYDVALDARRVGMKPVNEMDAMQELIQKGTAPIPTADGQSMTRTLVPNAFIRAGDDLDAIAKSGTGFKRANADSVFSPKAQETIEGVRVGLARQQQADKLGGANGSPTAKFLIGEDIINGITGAVGDNKSLLGRALNSLAPSLTGITKVLGVPERFEGVLAKMVADPAKTQAILAGLPAPDRVLLEQALGRVGGISGVGLSLGQE